MEQYQNLNRVNKSNSRERKLHGQAKDGRRQALSGGSGGGRQAEAADTLMGTGPGSTTIPAHRPGTQAGSPQGIALREVGRGDIGGGGQVLSADHQRNGTRIDLIGSSDLASANGMA